MLIIQISAAYKPAYIYGGPTMSVAKLCEVLCNQNLSSSETLDLEVLTTTANGPTELAVGTASKVEVDGVPVTYFKRLTKDHTHFSPTLLGALNRKIKEAKQQRLKPIIHIHAWWNLVSILSACMALWHRVPVILSPRGMLTAYTLHNRNGIFKSALHAILGKRLLRYCHIHATS